MKDTIEIRWHGRGGQGAKTAALLLADVAFKTGKYVQGFPEYGPERMGAPITAYNRLSDKPITIHSNIYEPDLVAVVDDSLLETIDVTHGLGPEGAVIVNSQRPREEIVSHLRGYRGRLYVIDAREISVKRWANISPILPCWPPWWPCPALWNNRCSCRRCGPHININLPRNPKS